MLGKTTYSTIFITLFLFILLLTGCEGDTSNLVAKSGDWKLSTKEFRDAAIRRFGGPEGAARKTDEELYGYAEDMLVRKLQVRDAYKLGLDTAPEVESEYQDYLRKAAVAELYVDQILDKVISEEDLKEFYSKDREEIKASHILILDNEDTTPQAAKRKIDKIYEKTQKPGAVFKDLAQKYSEDETAPDGDLGWFRWGTMVDPFQEMAFSLQRGEISSPVKTEYGWHIIQLHDRRKVKNLGTFEDEKDRIKQQLSRQRRSDLLEAAKAFVDKEKEVRKVVYKDDNIKKIVEAIKSKNNPPDPYSALTKQEQDLPLAELDDGAQVITMTQIAPKMKSLGPQRPDYGSVEKIHEFIDVVLSEAYLLPDAARRLGLYEKPIVQERATEARDRKAYQLAYKQMVIEKAKPDENEAEKYYKSNPDKYMTDAQFTLVEILVAEKELGLEIAERARKGENMREMAAKYSVRRKAKENMGTLGPIRRMQYGIIGREAAKAKIGEVVGPLKHGSKWTVFKVISKEEPQLNEFQKVKNKVIADLRAENTRRLEKEWIDKLKKKYSWKIYKKTISNMFATERERLKARDSRKQAKHSPAPTKTPGKKVVNINPTPTPAGTEKKKVD